MEKTKSLRASAKNGGIREKIHWYTEIRIAKYEIEEKSKQNITRDIEIKNIVTIARGEWGGDSGERGL